jgi:hypothetical protein
MDDYERILIALASLENYAAASGMLAARDAIAKARSSFILESRPASDHHQMKLPQANSPAPVPGSANSPNQFRSPAQGDDRKQPG